MASVLPGRLWNSSGIDKIWRSRENTKVYFGKEFVIVMKSKTLRIPPRLARKALTAAYKAIPLSDYRIRLARKYFQGAASLYGCIPLGCLFQILEAVHEGLLTKEEFCAFAAIARQETDGYYIMSWETDEVEEREEMLDWCLVTPYLVVDGKARACVQEAQLRHGRWYVPEKEELLSYAEGIYPAAGEALQAFAAFLYAHRKTPAMDLADLFADLEERERYRMGDMDEARRCIESGGIVLASEEDEKEWEALYKAFHEASRMPALGGATPAEMKEMEARSGGAAQKPEKSGVFGIEKYYDTVFTKMKPGKK